MGSVQQQLEVLKGPESLGHMSFLFRIAVERFRIIGPPNSTLWTCDPEAGGAVGLGVSAVFRRSAPTDVNIPILANRCKTRGVDITIHNRSSCPAQMFCNT